MHADLKITGFVMAHLAPNTFGDLAQMVDQMRALGVSDDAEVIDGFIDFDLCNGMPEPIECGDHSMSEGRAYDWLLTTHSHDEPATFDWVEVDRRAKAWL
jgi:hypothetical protein